MNPLGFGRWESGIGRMCPLPGVMMLALVLISTSSVEGFRHGALVIPSSLKQGGIFSAHHCSSKVLRGGGWGGDQLVSLVRGRGCWHLARIQTVSHQSVELVGPDTRLGGRQQDGGRGLRRWIGGREAAALAIVLAALLVLPGVASAAGAAPVLPIEADSRQVLGFLLASGAFGAWAEQHTRLGQAISGAMVTFFTAMALSSLRLIPASSHHPVYGMVWEHLVPMAVCQMMLCLDRREVLRSLGDSVSMLKAFAVASAGTFFGSIAAHALVRIANGWQMASVFCATYIGGTLNFIATADSVGLRDPRALASAFSADMLMMAAYFSCLFFLAKRAGGDGDSDVASRQQAPESSRPEDMAVSPSSGGMLSCMAAGACLVWAGFALSDCVGGNAGVPLVTAMSLAVACLLPQGIRNAWGTGPQVVSGMCMQVFFATIGASTDASALLSSGTLAPLFAFIGVLLLVHAAALELVGRRLLGLPVRDLLLASNAAVGGPATAAAMASALGWNSKASPAVLCGSVGYAVGTYAGILAGWICKRMLA